MGPPLINLISATFLFALNVVVAVPKSNRGNTFDSTIRLYKGSTVRDFVSFNLTTAESVADHPKFNSKRQSMIFIHGWLQSPDSPVSEILLEAYLANGTFNILALDWSKASSHLLLDVVAQRAEQLGIAVAHFIDRWNSQKGVPFSQMHLVGHSTGAHLAGCAGKYTQRWSGQMIQRITGLDPGFIAVHFLHKSFARFVDIIHTDSTGLGTQKNYGHVDFWPNEGVAAQPGCPRLIIIDSICSHMRSIVLYAESVQRANRTGNFLSTNLADPNIVIEMGLNCPTNARGVYSLQTKGASYFSKS